MRAFLGFIFAPLAPAAVAWLLSLAPAVTSVSLPGSVFVLSLFYGFPLTAAFGVPMYLWFRHQGWLRYWQVALAGAIIGSLMPLALVSLVVAYTAANAGLLVATQTGFKEMGPLVPFGAGVGTLCASTFWLLALAPLPKSASAAK